VDKNLLYKIHTTLYGNYMVDRHILINAYILSAKAMSSVGLSDCRIKKLNID
jgi:hypothetical protein